MTMPLEISGDIASIARYLHRPSERAPVRELLRLSNPELADLNVPRSENPFIARTRPDQWRRFSAANF